MQVLKPREVARFAGAQKKIDKMESLALAAEREFNAAATKLEKARAAHAAAIAAAAIPDVLHITEVALAKITGVCGAVNGHSTTPALATCPACLARWAKQAAARQPVFNGSSPTSTGRGWHGKGSRKKDNAIS